MAKATATKTSAQKFKNELAYKIRAAFSPILVYTDEPERVYNDVVDIASGLKPSARGET